MMITIVLHKTLETDAQKQNIFGLTALHSKLDGIKKLIKRFVGRKIFGGLVMKC